MTTPVKQIWHHIEQTSSLPVAERFKLACSEVLQASGLPHAALIAMRENRMASVLHPGTFLAYWEFAAALNEWGSDCAFFDNELEALRDLQAQITDHLRKQTFLVA